MWEKYPQEFISSYNWNSICHSNSDSGSDIKLIKKNSNRKNNNLSLLPKKICKANTKKNKIMAYDINPKV